MAVAMAANVAVVTMMIASCEATMPKVSTDGRAHPSYLHIPGSSK